MQDNKVSKVLKNLGACYAIDHQAICRALKEESPYLLSLYNEDNPIGLFILLGNDGVRFVPLPKNPDVFMQMTEPGFHEQLTLMLDIILKKVPEYLMSESIERQSYEQNMAKLSDTLFALLIDLEALKSPDLHQSESKNQAVYKAINEAARFIGVLSDEYGIQGQAIAFSDESAIKIELVSRDEVGLGAMKDGRYAKSNETVH